MIVKTIRLGAASFLAVTMMALASPAYAGPVAPQAPPPISSRSQGPGDPGFTSPPSSTPSGGKGYTFDLSKSQWDKANRAFKAGHSAHTNKSGQIDYRWVKDKFSGHSTQLYEFTAGFWYRRQDWGQFTHISSSDKKKVIAWAKKNSGPNPNRVAAGETSKATNIIAAALAASGDGEAHAQRKAPKPCLGRTVLANNKEDKLYWIYYNSCDTKNLIDVIDAGAEVLGFVTAVVAVITAGTATLPPAAGGLLLWSAKKYMENRRDASDLEAIIIRVSYNVKKSKYGRYYAPFKIFPQ